MLKDKFIFPLSTFLFLTHAAAFPQDWVWQQDNRVLNPSGIDIRNNSAQFQVLDWNADGLWDFVINEVGAIVYYQQTPDGDWTRMSQDFPAIGMNEGEYYIHPKNFEFIDWDFDGDLDLAADSSKFWWNQGSQSEPLWVKDDSLLSGIESLYDYYFFDYDGDGDWDVVADEAPYFESRFFWNGGDNQQPEWSGDDTILPYANAAQFVDWNSDSLPDLGALDLLAGTEVFVTGYGTFGYTNHGTIIQPDWRELHTVTSFWTFFEQSLPAYDLVDFDANKLTDIVKTDWRNHIAIHTNHGNADSAVVGYEPDRLVGAVNVESHARPVFFEADQDGLIDLLVTGDVLIDFTIHVFADGRVLAYKNAAGHFDPGITLDENVPTTKWLLYPNFQKNLTLSFADVDADGDLDYILGFVKTNEQGEPAGCGVLYYENRGTKTTPNWQLDSSRFTYFLAPDSNFYDPRLIDIDQDADFDLLVQKDGNYTFYERLNTVEETWQENSAWLQGISSRKHHSAVFADLTRDGLPDLIFGEEDGTLTFYEYVGSPDEPPWRRVDEAFAGIDVGELAAPAFADLNGDSKLDMIVGNAEGFLFYFRNESTVDVKSEPIEPATFRLHQNYPNPFNPETTIEYEIAEAGQVRLSIYNLLGQRVRTLVDEWQPAGLHRVHWDGTRDGFGGPVSSGLYFYELRFGNTFARKRMLYLR